MVTIGLSCTVSEINGDLRRKSNENRQFPHRVFNAAAEGVPLGILYRRRGQETRVMGLSDGRKSFQIGLAVLIQYRSVTATQQASHVAVAITLNAKASSLKNQKPRKPKGSSSSASVNKMSDASGTVKEAPFEQYCL